MPTIKMIATDIDGTFITSDHDFNQLHFQRVLKQLNARQIKFAIASGNQMRHLTDMFAGYDNLAFLAENGGLVTIDNQPIFTETISPSDLQVALQLIHHDEHLIGGSVISSGIHGAYLERDTTPELIAGANYFYSGLQLCDNLTAINDDIFKLDLVWSDDLAANRATFLNQHLPDTLTATPSGFGGLDIIPSHVSKEVGLTALEKYWDIQPNEVMTFGDNDNDLSMLTHTDYGYAMANAATNIRAAAPFTTQWTNDEDGVLRTIDEVLGLN